MDWGGDGLGCISSQVCCCIFLNQVVTKLLCAVGFFHIHQTHSNHTQCTTTHTPPCTTHTHHHAPHIYTTTYTPPHPAPHPPPHPHTGCAPCTRVWTAVASVHSHHWPSHPVSQRGAPLVVTVPQHRPHYQCLLHAVCYVGWGMCVGDMWGYVGGICGGYYGVEVMCMHSYV